MKAIFIHKISHKISCNIYLIKYYENVVSIFSATLTFLWLLVMVINVLISILLEGELKQFLFQ